MPNLSFNSLSPILSRINRIWDFREGSGSGYVWGPISHPRGIDFLDLNQDGFKDLVLVPTYFDHNPSCSIIYSLNNGSGQFTTFSTLSPQVSSAFSSNGTFQLTWKGESYLLIVDQGNEIMRTDGHFPGSKVWLYRFDESTNTLVDATSLLPDNNLAFNHVSRLGDINNDGNTDLLFSRLDAYTAGGAMEGAVWWSFEDTIINRSSELPTQIAESTNRYDANVGISIQHAIGSISYGDFDGNGVSDIVSIGYLNDSGGSFPSIRIYYNFEQTPLIIEAPTFIKNSHYYPGTTTSRTMGAADCVVGDVDNDGDDDLLVMWEGAGNTYLQMLRNDGNQNFTDVTDTMLNAIAYREPNFVDADGNNYVGVSRVSLSDIDSDGYVDIVLRTYMVAGEGLVENGNYAQSFLYKNNHALNFTPYDFSGLSSGFSSLYQSTELRSWVTGFPILDDITGDGVSDLTFVKGAETFTTHNGERYSDYYQVVTLTGSHGNGNDRNDILNGDNNNNVFGGDGRDTVIFSMRKQDAVLTVDTARNVSVEDRNHVLHHLSNVERIRFSDGYVAYDLEGNAGKTAKILGAVFGADAVSNKAYAGVGISLLDNGMSYETLCQLAIQVSGVTTNNQVVSLLWTNIMGVAPTSEQVQPFVNMLNSGMSLGQLGVLAADTSLNQSNINLTGLTSQGFEYFL